MVLSIRVHELLSEQSKYNIIQEEYKSLIPTNNIPDRKQIYHKNMLELSEKTIELKKTVQNIKKNEIIIDKVENEGYCMYHKGSGCPCGKDADGRVKHGYTYPFEKRCGTHDSLKCQCPRLPSGEMIVKATMTDYAHGPPKKYCDAHKTWYCACKRDKYGTVMSKKHGYPIEKYCSVHDSPDCGCY